MFPLSNCSAFDSVAFHVLPVITWIGAILNIFGVYIILFFTPKSMTDYAKHLLLYQVSCAVCDLIVGEGLSPLFVFPPAAVTPLGILRKLGVDSRIQIVLGFQVAFAFFGTLVQLFFFKQQKILLPDSRMKLTRRDFLFACYSTEIILVTMPLFINLYYFLDDDIAGSRQLVLERFPSFACVVEDPFFYAYSPARGKVVAAMCCTMLTVVLVFIVVCLATSFSALRSNRHFRSVKSRQLQRMGIHVLIIQTSVPSSVLMIPLFIGISCILTEDIRLQVACPWLVFSVGIHGITSTICTITLHEPYRRAVTSLLARKPAISGISFVTVHHRGSLFLFVHEISNKCLGIIYVAVLTAAVIFIVGQFLVLKIL